MIAEKKNVKTMRSMPHRLNSAMRALIPFKLNTTLKKGKIMIIENERILGQTVNDDISASCRVV